MFVSFCFVLLWCFILFVFVLFCFLERGPKRQFSCNFRGFSSFVTPKGLSSTSVSSSYSVCLPCFHVVFPLKIDTPHLQKVRADFFGGFFGGFCKVNLRKGLPHKRSSRGHNWRSAKAHKNFPPQYLRHFLFLFHSHSHSLQRCHAQDERPKNLPPTSAQTRNFSNARTRRHHLLHPSFSSSRWQRTQSVPRAPAAKLLATPPRPPFNKADVPTSRNCSSKPTPTQQSFLWKRSSTLRHIVGPHTSEERRGRRRILRNRQRSWAGASLAHSVSESDCAVQTASSEWTRDWQSKKEARCLLG